MTDADTRRTTGPGVHPGPHGEQHGTVPPEDVPARPRTEPRSLQYHDLAGSRPQPAGRVLVIGALALFLAALLNADGMAELANRQQVGWKRDVARVAVAPFCAVGGLTRIKEIRGAIRDAADKTTQGCDQDPSGADSFVAPTATTIPAEAAGPTEPAVATRAPTAADPLRTWLGGDSMTIELSQSTEELLTDRPEVAITTHPQVSSGLTRPDFFDWPTYFAEDVLPEQPEAVVVMFGANDSQGMEIDGTPYQPSDPEWQEEYRRRVGVVMDQLRGEGRLVLWVGQPHMADDGFDERMGVLNEIYASEAESRPWVDFLDSRGVLSPDQDGYQATDDSGASLRQSDGVHLDRAGADLLAEAVVEAVTERVVEGEPPG